MVEISSRNIISRKMYAAIRAAFQQGLVRLQTATMRMIKQNASRNPAAKSTPMPTVKTSPSSSYLEPPMRTASEIDKKKNPINVFSTPVTHTNMLAQFAPWPLALLKVNVEGDASKCLDRDLGEKQDPPMLTSLGNGEDRLSPAEISKYTVFTFF